MTNEAISRRNFLKLGGLAAISLPTMTQVSRIGNLGALGFRGVSSISGSGGSQTATTYGAASLSSERAKTNNSKN